MYSTVACAAIGMDRAENTLLLLLFTGHYLVAAVVQLLTSRSLPSKGSTCYNILIENNKNSLICSKVFRVKR
jgi:hypothetical protein